jgi:hypothetical protein
MFKLCTVMLCGCASTPAVVNRETPACATDDGTTAVQTIRDMYAALTVDDAARANRLFAPSFYAFDVGKRYTGESLVALVKSAHEAGKKFVWEVTAPAAQVSCDFAWVTWENRGSIADATTENKVIWLESAVLRWTDGRWQILFFHSTRGAEARGTR